MGKPLSDLNPQRTRS